MKLKTLKDITIPSKYYNVYCYMAMTKELKKEAINWINNFEKEYNNVARDILKFEFMNFFNLTEEDLKEAEK